MHRDNKSDNSILILTLSYIVNLDELKENLILQSGIIYVDIEEKDIFIELRIKYNVAIISETIIFKSITLFVDEKFPILYGFKKINKNIINKLEYKKKNICCEYCLCSIVTYMFNNADIISVEYTENNFLNETDFIVEYTNEIDGNYIINILKGM